MGEGLRSRKRSRKSPEIGIAPLVDLVFLLLIFFILSSTLAEEQAVPVRRPSAATSSRVSAPPILVTVTAAGTIHLQGRRVALAVLEGEVRRGLAMERERKALVAADEDARAGLLVRVMDACRLAGASEVLLATSPEEEGP